MYYSLKEFNRPKFESSVSIIVVPFVLPKTKPMVRDPSVIPEGANITTLVEVACRLFNDLS